MVKIVGLTDGNYKTRCPVGKIWPEAELEKFRQENAGFMIRDGRIMSPYEEDPNMFLHGVDWYWLTHTYYPVFNEHYVYVGHVLGGKYYALSDR